MKRALAVIAALLLTCTSALAQQSKAIASTSCVAGNITGCFVVNTQGAGSIGIDVRGTFVGTVEFEQSVTGDNYVSMASFPNASATSATNTTTTGYWVANPLGALYVRFRFSAFTSGAAIVSVARSSARSNTAPTGSFSGNITTPAVIGGTGTTSTLTLQATSGVGTTGSDVIVKVGNNGATEAARFFSTGVSTYGLPCSASGCDVVPSFGFQFTGVNLVLDRFNAGTGGALIVGRHARGTVSAPGQTLSGDNLTNLIGRGWQSTTPAWTSATNASITMQAAENFTSTNQGTRIILQNTPIGSVTTQDALTLNGTSMVLPATVFTQLGTASASVNYGTQPLSPLHVLGTATTIFCDRESADAVPCAFVGRKARGTLDTPTQALANDNLAQLIGQGWETTTPGWSSAANGVVGIQATENFTSAAQGTKLIVNLTPTGSITAARFMTGSAAGLTFSQVSGTAMAVANVGANSCGTTTATIAGNQTVGEVTVGATSGTQCRITVPQATTTRFNGSCSNQTTAALCRLVAVSTTTFDLLGAFTAGDVVAYAVFSR